MYIYIYIQNGELNVMVIPEMSKIKIYEPPSM